MASPFTVFRRNQKIMLAVITVAAMFAFVFLDPLARYIGRNTQRADTVAVETRYGNLRESDLYSLRQTRKIVEEFVRRLVETAIMGLVEKKVVDPRQISIEMEINQALRFTVRSKPGTEEAAVETFVLARRAEQMGIVVSDNSINEFLKRITFDSLTSDQIAQIIAQLKPQGLPMSQGRLFDALRTELLAAEFTQMFEVGLAATPPAQRWDYFERVNRRASVELLALPVANFLSEVPDPKNAELREFFDKHKERIQQPGSPEPGFKQPKKAAFQYFKADYDKFVERAEAQVTDEQIQEFYEKNKHTRFRETQLPPESETPATKPQTPAGKENAAPGKENAAPGKENKPPQADAGQPAAPAAVKPESAAAPPASPAAVPDAKPAAPGTPAPTPAPKAEPEKSPNSAAVRRPSGASIRLISAPETLLAQEKPPAPEPPAAKAPAAPPAAVPPAAAPAATTPGSPPSEKPTAEAAPPVKAEALPTVPATEKPATEQKPAADQTKTEPAAPPVKYEPLEKVKGVIRKDLARTEARRQIDKALDELELAMRHYSDDLVLYESQGEPETKGAPPTPLDFAGLAKLYGVTAHETDLISAEEARDETDIGRSYIRIPDPRSRFGERLQSFDEVAFDDGLLKNKPVRSEDISANFLFWKTRSTEEQVPDFDKVRPQVLRAWKMIAARKVAQEKAEKYLAEAKRDKATLEETFGKQPELKVIKPPMFSWMTMGNVPRDPSANRPRLSEVSGVDQPGDEFLKTVFELSPGEFGVAINHPETVVYVVHLLSFDRALDSLFQQFGSEPFQMYRAVGLGDMERAYRSWISNLMTEAKVHWEREPFVERNRS
jgi:hypothetical protein